MYRNMNDWTEIRRRVLVEGVSRRQILRETGMHRQTLKKIWNTVAAGLPAAAAATAEEAGGVSGADQTDLEG